MFTNSHTAYSMLFGDPNMLVERQYHTIDIFENFSRPGALVHRTEDFEKYQELENFLLEKMKKQGPTGFVVIVEPDIPNYFLIAQNRAALRAYLNPGEPAGADHDDGGAAAAPLRPAAAAGDDDGNRHRDRRDGNDNNEERAPKRRRRASAAAAADHDDAPPPIPNGGRVVMVYAPFDGGVPEGEVAKQIFISKEFEALKNNYTAVTGQDPFFPPNREITLLSDLVTKDRTKLTVNQKFWMFCLSEFEAHQRARILRGEERSNCFKKGASASWRRCDLESTRINFVQLPPKGDFYKPALGTD
jgi:hypothetical protein